ncbi:MAG: hypothetical protein U5K31_11785 [Balneolaceae bacterium]|nr:hypothetical protein [Balneolaceae bacterium]
MQVVPRDCKRPDQAACGRCFGRVQTRASKRSKSPGQIQPVAGPRDRSGLGPEGTYFGPSFKNRRHSDRKRLRKAGKVKRGRGAKELQQPVFGIYQRQDGIVYVVPVAEVDKLTLQDIIRDKVSIETTIYSDTWQSEDSAC